MARKPRIWYPGAIYHITSRGNRKESIFYDDRDRKTYLKILEEARMDFPFILHTYCLMTNHIHLLLETIDHHPKEIMKFLNSRYAVYFNRRHQIVGHLFQGRYGAEIIDSLEYFIEVSRYIHFNPVKAEIVEDPLNYSWSSYPTYVSEKRNPHITTEKVLSYFSEPKKENYRLFVETTKNN